MILRPSVQPYFTASLACFALVGSAAYDLYRERAQAIQTARGQTAALARLLEENVHQLFRRAEVEIDDLAQRDRSEQRVLPSDGFLRSAGPVGEGIGLIDAWRMRLQQAAAGVLQVDRLRRDAAGAWGLAVGKRLPAADGGTSPAWQAQLDLKPLQRLLDTADTRNNGFATLFTLDGWLLATAPRNLPLGIAYLDSSLRYQFVNLAQSQHLGLPREAILGRTNEELTGQAVPDALKSAIERAMRGQAQDVEIEEPAETGLRALATLLVPERDDTGRVAGLYAASLDITERFEQRRRLDAALKERETLLREVYHRVKNNLQVIQSLLRLQRRNLSDPAAKEALDESAARVRAMALVHERLYQSESLEAVPLRDYSQELLQFLDETTGAGARDVRLQADVVAIEAPIEAAIPYGLLVNELVSNSLKHGFAAGSGGVVRLTVEHAEVGLRMTLRDDGVGLPAGFTLGADASMGLQLACSLAAQLGGQLTARSDSGAVFINEMHAFARSIDA
jgi:PAS domain S-box-containing protein